MKKAPVEPRCSILFITDHKTQSCYHLSARRNIKFTPFLMIASPATLCDLVRKFQHLIFYNSKAFNVNGIIFDMEGCKCIGI